jgi:hypothetical protein
MRKETLVVLFFLTLTIFSNTSKVAASVDTSTITTPTQPTNFNIQQSIDNPSIINISWSTESSSQTRFEVSKNFYSNGGGGSTYSIISSNIDPNLRIYSDGVSALGYYYYYIKACNNSGCSATSSKSIMITAPTAPTTISSTKNTNSATLTWRDTSSNESYFKILRGTSLGNLTQIATGNKDTASYTDMNLSPGTYFYGISACNSLGCSSVANFANSVTVINSTNSTTPTEDAGITTAPSSPANIMTEITSISSIKISWGDVTNETTYKINRSFNGGASTLVYTNGANTLYYYDNGLTPGTYKYTIQACNGTLCSTGTASSVVTIAPTATTNEVIVLPDPIVTSYLTTETINPTQNSTLFYTSANASYCKIGYSDGTATQNNAPITNSIILYGKDHLLGVTISIECFNIKNASSKSVKTLTVTKPSTENTSLTAPLVPSNLQTVATSSHSVTIAWKDNATNETGYKISKSINDGPTTLVFTSEANVTSYVDSNISTSGTHTYYVQACNGVTKTNCSLAISEKGYVANSKEEAEAVLQETSTVPDAPTSVNATRTYLGGVPSNTIHLSWSDTSKNRTGFSILRSSQSSVVELPTVNGSTFFYDDNNLKPEIYTYYIKTCNEMGCSLTSTKTDEIIIPEVVMATNQEELTSLLEISKAVGNTTPGTFINIIPKEEVSTPQKAFTTTTLADGSFQIKVPDGVYIVEGITPVKVVTLAYGKVTNVVEKITTGVKKITGTITFPSGTLITNAEVSAYKKETGEWLTTTPDASGNYTIKVSPGVWDVSIRPKNGTVSDWEGQKTLNTASFSNQDIHENRNVDLTILQKTSNLSITVKNEEGLPLSDIGVLMDTVSSSDTQNTNTSRKILTEKTDSNGFSTLHTSAGKYFIRILIPSTLEYSDVSEITAMLTSNETKSISVTLKKKINTTSKITGLTTFNDGTPTEAFISAWSNEGDRLGINTSSKGSFSFETKIGTIWHIRATKDSNGKAYSSDEQTVLAATTNNMVEFSFVKSELITLPSQVSVQKKATEQVIISSNNGARFTLPANSVNSDSSIEVAIKPTVEAPSQSISALVSTAYDITVKNSNGQKFTKLTTDAEILIPYNEGELSTRGTTLQNVTPSYYDENLKSWIPVPNFTINTIKKVFVLHVNHLTRFALIAAADTTAPTSPTSVVSDYITPTDVRITWKNPAQDFDHVKIYRSEKQGTFGNIIASEVFSNSFIDKTNSLAGKVYYYTIRAVDKAGNESNNQDQLAFVSKGTTLASSKKASSLLLPPGQESSGLITQKLSLGSEGDDVIALQKALKLDGFYATGPITGYYGKRTENAVFRFQNYYKNELLIPNGYKLGTGVVGEITRKKINEIIVNGAQ